MATEPTISIRAINPQFDKTSSRYWFDENPYATHMIHALSFLFPPGEEMFVKSVLYYRDQIKDPQLRKAIKAFAGQESLHSKSHQDFNNWIASKVPEADVYCEAIAKDIHRNYARLEKSKPIANLAVTVALEHITAIMAATFLRRPEILEKIDPEVRSLLIWHSIEEIEHKNVAFDVYQAVGGTYWLRVYALIMSTLILSGKTAWYQFRLLANDGGLWNVRAAWQSFSQLFGMQGFVTSLLKTYFHYFKPSFHPSQHQDQHLIEEWHQKLTQLTPVRIAGKVELRAVGGA